MNEIIITIVTMETQDGLTYPITAVRRIEFNTYEQMEAALTKIGRADGVTNAEYLSGPSWTMQIALSQESTVWKVQKELSKQRKEEQWRERTATR